METLIKIQTELKAPKDQFNKFGNYAYRNCEDILEAVKPLLKKYNCTLIITDELVMVGERYYVKATAIIKDDKETASSNAFARESDEKKGMDQSQITGAASSYARKYALNGLFLIDDNKEIDSTHKETEANNSTDIINVIKQVNESKSIKDLENIWTTNKNLQTAEAFLKAITNKKKELSHV